MNAPSGSSAELRPLVLRTLQVQQHGQPTARNLAALEGNFDERSNARSLRKNLSLREISVVYRSAGVREKGLKAARTGDLVSAARLIGQARDLFQATMLCKEALAFLESFQLAAEAYLQYKERHYDQARASLLGAIRACHVLRDEFGYLIEARRVHLARNIVRVETLVNNPKEAMRLASCLERYLEGCPERWPFLEFPVATVLEPLSDEIRLLLMDQILGEIALLWSRRNPQCRELMIQGSELLLRDGEMATGIFARVHTWLAAMGASAEDDVRGFLEHALYFFSERPGYLGNAWRELSLEFFDVAKDITPELVH
jgi:hypothetical protein